MFVYFYCYGFFNHFTYEEAENGHFVEDVFLDSPDMPVYQKHFSTKTKTCSAYFKSDPNSVLLTDLEAEESTITLVDPVELDMDCGSIRSRGHFPDQPLSEKEAAFPLAFVKIVFKDYLFLEMQFRVEFQPQNIFCFSIDKKSTDSFKTKIFALQKCFPKNIFIADQESNALSNGKGMCDAHLSCLQKIQPQQFKYAFLLQNHDVKIKTNRELVEILMRFHGANDVSAMYPTWGSYDKKADFSLKGLNIFRNASKNNQLTPRGYPETLKMAKSLVQVTLSKKAVDYIVTQLNLTTFIRTLETVRNAMDEDFIATLNLNEVLEIPGGFTSKCLKKAKEYTHFTRYNEWDGGNVCGSGIWRHSLCLFGVKDLLRIKQKPQFFANKMMPEADFAAIDCLAERLHNMTYFMPFHYLNRDYRFYENLDVVRYNKFKEDGNDPASFDCQLGISNYFWSLFDW